MALTTTQGSAAYLNRALNDANATPTAFAATVADLAVNEMAAADKFDVATLTDAALSKQVLTNMGVLPSTNADVLKLETELAAYFGGMGKGHRGFVVLQLARILADKTADATYGAAATAWNTEVAASITESTSGAYALTSSTTDNLIGGSAEDIFTAISSALASAGTLNSTDKITGGAGNDVLNVSVATTWGGLASNNFTSIETVNLTNSNGNDLSFDMTGITGVTAISIAAPAGQLDVTDVASGLKSLTISGIAKATGTQDFNLTYAADATETAGLTDALTVNLNTVGLADTTAIYRNAVLTLGDIETVNVVATGSNNVALDSADMTKLTVAGSGDFTLNSTGANLTTVDASSFSGTSYLGLDSVGSSKIKTVTGGSGSDTVSVDMPSLKANATLAGGAGTNELDLTNSGAAAAAEYIMSGIQTIAFGATAGGITLSAAQTTGLTTVKLASTTDEIISLVNMGAANLTMSQTGTGGSVTHNSDHSGTTTLNFVKSSTATAASPSNPVSDFTFSKATGTLNVSIGASVDTSTTTITSQYASAVNLTVASSTTAAGAQATVFDSKIDVARATAITITADGKLATGAEIVAPKATTATITYNGTSAQSAQAVLELDTPLLTSLNLTTATSFNTTTSSSGPSTLTGLQTLVVNAKSGTTTFGDLLDASSITLSGTGASSTVILGTVGATDNAYDVNLTATGLQSSLTYATAGLTVTDINVGAGYDVNVNVSGMTGSATIADGVTIGDTNTDDVTVTATNLGGVLTLGGITAKGDVTVLASGARGATVGNLTGDNIKVDISNTSDVSSVGTTIAALTSVDLNLHALAASANYDITASTGSTAIAVKVNGGLNDDDVTINSNITVKNITLTGNLGADTTSGNDDVTINAIYAVAKTIDLSGLTKYETSTIYGGTKIDTIVGGAGVDTIYGGLEADVLTGGAGADVFWFNGTDSTYDKPDTISDLSTTDIIKYGFTNADAEKATAIEGTDTAANIDAFGVATFAAMTSSSTLALKVAGINKALSTTGHTALFTHDGSTYLFADTDGVATANTTGVVVKLTGVVLPTLAANIFDDDASGTGLSGFSQ